MYHTFVVVAKKHHALAHGHKSRDPCFPLDTEIFKPKTQSFIYAVRLESTLVA